MFGFMLSVQEHAFQQPDSSALGRWFLCCLIKETALQNAMRSMAVLVPSKLLSAGFDNLTECGSVRAGWDLFVQRDALFTY